MKDMSVTVASQQVEVFSKVFKTAISKFVQDGVEMQQANLDEINVSVNFFLFFFFSMNIFSKEYGAYLLNYVSSCQIIDFIKN